MMRERERERERCSVVNNHCNHLPTTSSINVRAARTTCFLQCVGYLGFVGGHVGPARIRVLLVF